MKILYVGMRHNYGKPQQGFSFEHYNFYDALIKMDKEKHEVVYFPFDEILWERGRDGMNTRLFEVVEKVRPDLCFFILFENEFKQSVIKEISRRYPTLNWFTDDHWRFDNYSKYWAPFFGWIATTDSHAPEKYKKLGYRNIIKTQWACNHFIYGPSKHPETHDISFIGQATIPRKEIANNILEAELPLKCWGSGWEGEFVNQQRMIDIFSGSKINLNMTEASQMSKNLKTIGRIFIYKTINEGYGIEHPRHWMSNTVSYFGARRTQIKGRNFEIPGCGGFLMTGDADNLRDYYTDGREIVIYKNVGDLVEKANYYLTHENERNVIALAGYTRTMRDHTYEKRFKEIFRTIGLD